MPYLRWIITPFTVGRNRKAVFMNEWYEQAAKKLNAEKKAAQYDRYGNVMKDAVHEALDCFCQQDTEFAQAVVQGGTFGDCMKAVAKGCGNSISDLEAFRRAVRFYFPGTDVRFHMMVNLCASVESEEPEQTPAPKAGCKVLDLEDFL